MKVICANNNYSTPQKQQAFGATPGQTFLKGLQEVITTHYGSNSEKALALLNSESATNFMRNFADTKIDFNGITNNPHFPKSFDPIVDIINKGKNRFAIHLTVPGLPNVKTRVIKPKGIRLAPSTTILDEVHSLIYKMAFKYKKPRARSIERKATTLQDGIQLLVSKLYQNVG